MEDEARMEVLAAKGGASGKEKFWHVSDSKSRFVVTQAITKDHQRSSQAGTVVWRGNSFHHSYVIWLTKFVLYT
jgi:hypothetical protein